VTHAITMRWKQHKKNPPRLFVQTVWWSGNRCHNTTFSVRAHGLVGAVKKCYQARKRVGAALPPVPPEKLAYMLTIPMVAKPSNTK
jgi:hypothetical protein